MLQLPREALLWREHGVVAADVSEEVAPAIDWCSNRDVAKRRAERLGVGVPEDYLERLIEFEDGKLLCGIRFYGGDVTKPFVELVASTRPIRDLDAAVALVLPAYAAFGVTEVRVLRPGVSPPACQARGDQVLVAAPLSAIAAQAPASTTLTDADIDEALSFIDDRFAAFAEARPSVAALVEPATADGLTDCRDDGRLCWFHVDGQRAGLIGVRRGTQCGIAGFEVVTELVAASFLGRRTAAGAQRRLAATLIADGAAPSLALHGTIAFANTASRRAARAAGRSEIAAWWFLRP